MRCSCFVAGPPWGRASEIRGRTWEPDTRLRLYHSAEHARVFLEVGLLKPGLLSVAVSWAGRGCLSSSRVRSARPRLGPGNPTQQYTYNPGLSPEPDTVMVREECEPAAGSSVALQAPAERAARPQEASPAKPARLDGTVLRLTTDELVRLAPRLRPYLASPAPTWPELVDAADWLRSELGGSKPLWGEACPAMRREEAPIAIAIVSAKPAGRFGPRLGVFLRDGNKSKGWRTELGWGLRGRERWAGGRAIAPAGQLMPGGDRLVKQPSAVCGVMSLPVGSTTCCVPCRSHDRQAFTRLTTPGALSSSMNPPAARDSMTDREALERLARFLGVADALVERLEAEAHPGAERFRQAAKVQPAFEHVEARLSEDAA